MPRSWAAAMPALTAGERPRSSALTIRVRGASTSETEAFRQRQRLAQPVVALTLRRSPLRRRPPEPLDRDLEAGEVQVALAEGWDAGLGCVGGGDRLPVGIGPAAADQGGEI